MADAPQTAQQEAAHIVELIATLTERLRVLTAPYVDMSLLVEQAPRPRAARKAPRLRLVTEEV